MTSKTEIIKQFLDNTDIDPTSKAIIQAGAFLDIPNENIINMSVSALSKIETIKAEKMRPKKYYLKNATITEKKIHSMLTESTGTNIMDSGGSFGRSWQINRLNKDMRKNQSISYSVYESSDYVECSVDLFHFLIDNLDFSAKAKQLSKQFYKFCSKTDNSYLADMEDFTDNLTESKNQSYNSYNDDSILSQDIQYIIFEYEGSNFIMLQIHQGADIRGGYTKPVIFEVNDYFSTYQEIALKCDCLTVEGCDIDQSWIKKRRDPNNSWNCILFCPECKKEIEVLRN